MEKEKSSQMWYPMGRENAEDRNTKKKENLKSKFKKSPPLTQTITFESFMTWC